MDREGFYVQLRFSGADRWVTVAVSEKRPIATRVAGDAYRNLEDDTGRHPIAVRVVDARILRREGGPAAIRRAAWDIRECANRGPAGQSPAGSSVRRG